MDLSTDPWQVNRENPLNVNSALPTVPTSNNDFRVLRSLIAEPYKNWKEIEVRHGSSPLSMFLGYSTATEEELRCFASDVQFVNNFFPSPLPNSLSSPTSSAPRNARASNNIPGEAVLNNLQLIRQPLLQRFQNYSLGPNFLSPPAPEPHVENFSRQGQWAAVTKQVQPNVSRQRTCGHAERFPITCNSQSELDSEIETKYNVKKTKVCINGKHEYKCVQYGCPFKVNLMVRPDKTYSTNIKYVHNHKLVSVRTNPTANDKVPGSSNSQALIGFADHKMIQQIIRKTGCLVWIDFANPEEMDKFFFGMPLLFTVPAASPTWN